MVSNILNVYYLQTKFYAFPTLFKHTVYKNGVEFQNDWGYPESGRWTTKYILRMVMWLV